MDSSADKPSKKQPTARRDSILLRLLHGRLLTSDLFLAHWKLILFVLMVFISYITNKYECQTRMETIDRLHNELEVIQTERVRARSRYMSQIRESSMQERIDKMKLGLSVQTQPPYTLNLDEK